MAWKFLCVNHQVYKEANKRFKNMENVLGMLYTNYNKIMDLLSRKEMKFDDIMKQSYLHSEPNGIKAIVQGNKNVKEARMYVYFDIKKENSVILGFGTKDTQSEDIKNAKERLKDYEKESEGA